MATESDLRSPATLVAIARAAHVVGDRDLEKSAKRELAESFGIEIKFPKAARRESQGAAR
jgi:hypothetical protein